jgi:hypothetical protein
MANLEAGLFAPCKLSGITHRMEGWIYHRAGLQLVRKKIVPAPAGNPIPALYPINKFVSLEAEISHLNNKRNERDQGRDMAQEVSFRPLMQVLVQS